MTRLTSSSPMPEPRIVITSGEPAGIGPDIIASIDPARFNARLCVIGDRGMLQARVNVLNTGLELVEYDAETRSRHALEVIHEKLATPCQPGQLESANAGYVLKLLERACSGCLEHEFDAMVTAPVQKEIINRAGIEFSGHTEYLAELCNSPRPVMLLLADRLRVALATTHLPLRDVPDAISGELLSEIATILERDLRLRFGLPAPHIKVCGLNPHAGEQGYLGREEIEIIAPAIESMRRNGINLSGPYPADTLFTPAMLGDADAVLAMYHDQGLPVLKHAGFHRAVNTTLGLPVIRTSVDHGTALSLAGTSAANPESLFAAIDCAIEQALHASGA